MLLHACLTAKTRETEEKVKMEKHKRQAARARLVTAMLAGQSWQEAAAATAMPVKRAMAYRLVRAVRIRGEVALQDRRHGHPSKLRGEARTWVETYCRDAPQTPSREIQAALQERFHLSISISQINRSRAALGVGNHPPRAGKKSGPDTCSRLD
jgi:transposase